MNNRIIVALLGMALLSGCVTAGSDRQAASFGGAGSEQEAELYLSVIQSLHEQGKSQAALAFLDDYNRRYPNDYRAWVMRGEALMAAGRVDEAEQVFLAIENEPVGAAAQLGLGQVSASRGNWNMAVAYLAEATRLAPTSARVLNNYGYALLKLDRTDEARRVLGRAVELAPGNDQVRNNLLLATYRDGDESAAIQAVGALDDAGERQRLMEFVTEWTP